MVAVRNDRGIQSFNFRALVRFRLLVRQGNAALCFVAERDGGNEEFLLSVRRRFLALRGGSVSLCVANLRGEDFAGFLACCRFRFLVSLGDFGSPCSTGVRDEDLSGGAMSKPQRIR